MGIDRYLVDFQEFVVAKFRVEMLYKQPRRVTTGFWGGSGVSVGVRISKGFKGVPEG